MFVIDIIILAYLYVAFYLGKFRKIKDNAAITWRVVIFVMVTSVLKFVIIFQFLMPTDWSKKAYLPSHNLTKEEMGLVGIGAWTLTWFYPIWAPPFYLLGQYRDYAYKDFKEHYFEEQVLEEKENNKKLCFEGIDCSKHFVDIDKSDKDEALELLKNYKEKFNSVKCDDLVSVTRVSKYTLGLSMRKLKDEYGIDLYRCLNNSSSLYFAKEHIYECVLENSFTCYTERKHYLLNREFNPHSTVDDQIYSLVVDMEKIERNEVRSAILSDLCTYAEDQLGKKMCAEYLKKPEFQESRVI